MQYTGSSSVVEQVNTTYSWKLSRDLIVQVLPIGSYTRWLVAILNSILQIISLDVSPSKRQDTVLLSYSYTIDKPPDYEAEVEIYRWEMQAPSNCDSLCEGRSHRLPACISTTQGVKVAPQFCDKSAMPKIDDRACNTDCRLKWVKIVIKIKLTCSKLIKLTNLQSHCDEHLGVLGRVWRIGYPGEDLRLRPDIHEYATFQYCGYVILQAEIRCGLPRGVSRRMLGFIGVVNCEFSTTFVNRNES